MLTSSNDIHHLANGIYKAISLHCSDEKLLAPLIQSIRNIIINIYVHKATCMDKSLHAEKLHNIFTMVYQMNIGCIVCSSNLVILFANRHANVVIGEKLMNELSCNSWRIVKELVERKRSHIELSGQLLRTKQLYCVVGYWMGECIVFQFW